MSHEKFEFLEFLKISVQSRYSLTTHLGVCWGKRGIRKKSYAKCENIAHINNKCTLIMAKVIASDIKGKH